MKIVAFVTDLMDRSRFEAAPGEVTFARAAVDAAGADVVVVDLARFATEVAAIRASAPQARIVGFGPHVEADTLRQAVADGADEALPRSRMFADLAEVLGGG